MATTTIARRQSPAFRARIESETGDLFNASTDLATAAELAEEGIENPPVYASFYRTESQLYYNATGQAQAVPGFEQVEIDPDEAFISPSVVESDDLDYNFTWVCASRETFPFASSGMYFVDFTAYPKQGAAIVWRTWVLVQ